MTDRFRRTVIPAKAGIPLGSNAVNEKLDASLRCHNGDVVKERDHV